MNVKHGSGRVVKRTMDVTVSSVALVVASPVLAAAALAILIEDGRPVLYRQRRIGSGGREFNLVKLRSMRLHEERPEDVGQVRDDNALLTSVGRRLRRLKIDEVPQMAHVLSGEMSLVGPRPTLPSQVAEYDAQQRRRLEVPPGLTGWAQVNGNVMLSWHDRIALDVWYIDHWSPWLDLRIMLMTIRVVLRGERVNELRVEVARSYAHRAAGSC